MIIIDTNVLSEIVKPVPAPKVLTWFASQSPERLYTTTVTQAEILFGIELLPKGRRRDALRDNVTVMFEKAFGGRLVSFDESAAHAFAIIAAAHRMGGRTVSGMDSQIAAIALSRNAALATRNSKDFVDCGIELIDPWG